MNPEKKSYDPTLFEETAEYYARFRPGYPRSLIERSIKSNNLEQENPVLDLGCGTGHVAIELAKQGLTVYAVDPDASMIGEGLKKSASLGIHSIRWMIGSDEQITQLALPKVATCTMGASFHWMDRPKVLKQLGRIIVPNGTVSIFSGGFDRTDPCTDRWNDITSEVIREFLGPERRAGRGIYEHPRERHEDVLLRSPFNNLEKHSFSSDMVLTCNEIVGLQLSMSFASPKLLGAELQRFKSTLLSRLDAASKESKFKSKLKYELIIAGRSRA